MKEWSVTSGANHRLRPGIRRENRANQAVKTLRRHHCGDYVSGGAWISAPSAHAAGPAVTDSFLTPGLRTARLSPALRAQAAGACASTTRFSACVSSGGHYDVTDQSGTVRGSFDYTVTATTTLSRNTGDINQTATYVVTNGVGDTLTDTFTPSGCQGPCAPKNTTPQVIVFTNGSHTLNGAFSADQVASGQVQMVNPVYNVTYHTNYGENSSSGPIFGMPAQRCDRDHPTTTNNTVGCVFNNATPSWVPGAASGTTYPAYDQHLTLAIGSGLRSKLTKASTQTNAANRSKSCRRASISSGPAGMQCDEYPMASTNEGAASGGTVRSFAPCAMPSLPQNVTGSSGWSQCYIPSAQNMGAGNDLQKFYNNNRILTNDSFVVKP